MKEVVGGCRVPADGAEGGAAAGRCCLSFSAMALAFDSASLKSKGCLGADNDSGGGTAV